MKIKNSFKSICENDLITLEKSIGNILPTEYKSFLLRNNGGRPTPNLFKTINNEYQTDIQFFFGICEGVYDLITNQKLLDGRFTKELIAIGIDSGGNFILLNLNTEEIYFFDHETNEKYFISKSFNLFINSLFKENNEEDVIEKAISVQDTVYFKSILNNGINIDSIVNEFNQRIIIASALRNKLKLVKFFLENGAKIDGALFNACSNGHINVVQYLISNGANVNERDVLQNNDTALMQACFGGYLDIVKLLIKNGADIGAKDIYGQTPLNKSYWSNNQTLIDYLEKEV